MENVQLIYENCEVLTIPTNFIKFIGLTDISKDFTFNLNQEYITSTVKEAIIIIKNVHKLTDKLYLNYDNAMVSTRESNYQHVFNLLVDRKDITGITINGTDYYVPYNDGNNSSELLDDPINHYQNNHYDVDNDEITITFKKKDSPKTYEIGDFMPQDHLVYHNNN